MYCLPNCFTLCLPCYQLFLSDCRLWPEQCHLHSRKLQFKGSFRLHLQAHLVWCDSTVTYPWLVKTRSRGHTGSQSSNSVSCPRLLIFLQHWNVSPAHDHQFSFDSFFGFPHQGLFTVANYTTSIHVRCGGNWALEETTWSQRLHPESGTSPAHWTVN